MQLRRGDRRSVDTVEQLTSGLLLTLLISQRGQLTKSDWKITKSHQTRRIVYIVDYINRRKLERLLRTK